MHICQDELVIVGWVVEHVRHLWAYAVHGWHWLWHRNRAPVHEDGCCSQERHE